MRSVFVNVYNNLIVVVVVVTRRFAQNTVVDLSKSIICRDTEPHTHIHARYVCVFATHVELLSVICEQPNHPKDVRSVPTFNTFGICISLFCQHLIAHGSTIITYPMTTRVHLHTINILCFRAIDKRSGIHHLQRACTDETVNGVREWEMDVG